jgi:hypothetical protein
MKSPTPRPLAACSDFEPDLVLYYYGDSPEEVKRRVETHLKRCVACRRFLEELKTVLPLTVKPDDPSPDFWDAYSIELKRKLAAQEPEGFWKIGLPSWLPSWRAPVLAAAAVVLMVLTLSLAKGVWRSAQPPLPEGELQTILGTKENVEFFESLDLLEAMDLQESGETGRRAKEAA